MNVNVEKQSNSMVKLTIEIPVEELQPYLQKTAARLSEGMNIPGFRQGKAPYAVVVQRIGEPALYQEAAEDIVSETYPKAVLEQKLEAIGRPQIDLAKVAPGNPFIYTATVSLLPEITLGDYSTLKAKRKEIKIDESEISNTILQLQKMRAKESRVDRPAQKGDKVEVDVKISLDNVPVDDGITKNHPMVLGEGNFVPGLEDQLVGLKTGEEKKFPLTYPKNYFRKNLAGKKVDCAVKCNSVFQIELPPVDGDFLQSLGSFKTRQDLEKRIADNLELEARERENQRFELEMLNEIVESSRFGEIPDVLVDSELNRMIDELRGNIQRQGMEWEKYLEQLKKSEDEVKKDFRDQASKRIKSALVLRAIRLKEHLIVSSDDIDSELEKQKEQYKDDLETYNKVDAPEYRDRLEEILLNRKVFEFLADRSEK